MQEVRGKRSDARGQRVAVGAVVCGDLVLMAESIEELKEKLLQWKECMEVKGLKVNIEKTKVMARVKNCGAIEKMGTGCSGWIHKRCTNVKGSLARVEDAFVCKVCERADDGEVG